MADDEVLFSITDKNLDSGLRGVPVGTCQTSFVDPYEGVHYVGSVSYTHLTLTTKRIV